MTAGEALQAAALAALGGVDGLGAYDGAPLQAVVPYAVADTGVERDWSYKDGAGREVRLAVTLYDQGERPVRLRRLMGEAEAAVAALAGNVGGWTIVSLQFLRGRVVKERSGRWAGLIEFRVRMLASVPE